MTTCNTLPAPAPWNPRGVAVWLDSKIQAAGKPDRAAELVQACGAKHGFVWAWAMDGRRAKIASVLGHVSALEALGIAPAVWVFPSPDRVADCALHVAAIRHALPDIRVIADFEGRGWTRETVSAFVAMEPDAVTAVPSSIADPLFSLFDGVRTRMVQVERSGDDVKLIENTMRRWKEDGYVVHPVAGCFMGDDQRILGDARRLCFAPGSNTLRVDGISFYSASTIDGRDRVAIRTAAGWF